MKEDLKEAILGIEVTQFDGQKADLEELVNPKQLEKIISDWMPEVLSQELPVIPKLVADWYESEGKRSSWWNWFYKWGRDESRTELESKAIRWMQDFNEEAFVNMFLHGYTVEKEQKYYVMNNDNRMMLVRMMDGKTITEADPFKLEDMYEGEKKSHRLTEQEIKDYDERYWPFAVKIEELEK